MLPDLTLNLLKFASIKYGYRELHQIEVLILQELRHDSHPMLLHEVDFMAEALVLKSRLISQHIKTSALM
jgi:hypothetical protein